MASRSRQDRHSRAQPIAGLVAAAQQDSARLARGPLLPRQLKDAEVPDRAAPRVVREEQDFREPWMPERRPGGHAVQVVGSRSPLAPWRLYRFTSLSAMQYETAQSPVSGRAAVVPYTLAVSRARAIEAGEMGRGSTLFELMDGVSTRGTHEEREGRMMVRTGALSPQHALVEARVRRRPAAPPASQGTEMAPPAVMAPYSPMPPARQLRAPRMRVHRPEYHTSGQEVMMSGALPPPRPRSQATSSQQSQETPRSVMSTPVASSPAASPGRHPLRVQNPTPPGSASVPPSVASTALPPADYGHRLRRYCHSGQPPARGLGLREYSASDLGIDSARPARPVEPATRSMGRGPGDGSAAGCPGGGGAAALSLTERREVLF